MKYKLIATEGAVVHLWRVLFLYDSIKLNRFENKKDISEQTIVSGNQMFFDQTEQVTIEKYEQVHIFPTSINTNACK